MVSSWIVVTFVVLVVAWRLWLDERGPARPVDWSGQEDRSRKWREKGASYVRALTDYLATRDTAEEIDPEPIFEEFKREFLAKNPPRKGRSVTYLVQDQSFGAHTSREGAHQG